MNTERYCRLGDHKADIDNFYISPSAPDGLHPYCIDCCRKKQKEDSLIKEENPEDPRDEIYYNKYGNYAGNITSSSIKYVRNVPHRWCTHKGHWVERSNFSRDNHCKDCVSEKDIPDRRFVKYGITKETYDEMWRKQKGKCGICSKDLTLLFPRQRHIDHCHETEKVRGILCSSCNQDLGSFMDSLDILEKASLYLYQNS